VVIHSSDNLSRSDDRTDWRGASKATVTAAVLAVIGIGAGIGLSLGGRFPFRGFLFGYLAGYAFVLAMAIGSIAFVLLQHVTRAAWSVSIRRIAENFAATMPLLAVLALPMLISVASSSGSLYRWALPWDLKHAPMADRIAAAKGEDEVAPRHVKANVELQTPTVAAPSDPSTFILDPLDVNKRIAGMHWLNPWFWIGRVIFYFACWIGIAWWYRRLSIEQDRTGDDALTLRMQVAAGPCLVLLGLTVTGFAFDLLMSLDPHWYSTMFGVYYIAECLMSSFAIFIITVYFLQKAGYLRDSISIEHYHDMGKYLFTWTFFYGYIGFAQYMLIWYANIPEETQWMARHGVSTAVHNGWNGVIIAILFGHFLIPFCALMSRHPKRRRGVLTMLAFWQLFFVAVDMYWIVTPEMGPSGPDWRSIVEAVLGVAGLTAAFFAGFAYLSARASLRPLRDPRLAASLVFQNI